MGWCLFLVKVVSEGWHVVGSRNCWGDACFTIFPLSLAFPSPAITVISTSLFSMIWNILFILVCNCSFFWGGNNGLQNVLRQVYVFPPQIICSLIAVSPFSKTCCQRLQLSHTLVETPSHHFESFPLGFILSETNVFLQRNHHALREVQGSVRGWKSSFQSPLLALWISPSPDTSFLICAQCQLW